MIIRLKKASNADAQTIIKIQVKAFMPLLEKSKDYHTNPANEPIERVIMRINNPDGGFYKILAANKLVCAICVFCSDYVCTKQDNKLNLKLSTR
ncbi:hypothetical protein JOC77_001611 [Peribacillus deserti]|uniref:N-acetyltransferase domain-containing protein n=1 Tax=Peribacillus deserti TaxID=673318 RepID=A0ABS2QGA4_9BACI|nr:hypothetical protein [Peribacillus deserti]MBM7692184.1 hypothetical protein [Peribacillus deserti]